MAKKDTSDKFNAVPEDFVFLDENDTKKKDAVEKAKKTLGIK